MDEMQIICAKYEEEKLKYRNAVQDLQREKINGSSQINRLAERLSHTQDRLNKLSRLEAGVIDFHMEIADRYSLNDTVEMGNSDFESKRAAVIRSAKNDSLVLLNQLRTNVRVQLAHKEDYEKDLKRKMSTRDMKSLDNEKGLRASLVSMQEQCRMVEKARDLAVKAMEDAAKSKEAISVSTRSGLEKLQAECRSLRKEIIALKEKCKTLDAERSEEEKRNRELTAEVTRMSSLEKKLKRCATNMKANFANKPSSKFAAQVQSQTKLNRLQAENAELQETVKTLQTQIKGFAANVRMTNVISAQRKMKRTADAAEKVKQDLEIAKQEINDMKDAASKTASKMAEMKIAYDKLFQVAQSQKGLPPRNEKPNKKCVCSNTKAIPNSVIKQMADKNPYVLDYYRGKLEKRQDEIKSLKGQFRQVVTSEHDYRLKMKIGQIERNRLAEQSDELRDELQRTQSEMNCLQRTLSRNNSFNNHDSSHLSSSLSEATLNASGQRPHSALIRKQSDKSMSRRPMTSKLRNSKSALHV